MRRWLIERFIEFIRKDESRQILLTEVVHKLYNTVSADDILQLNEQGQWTFGKQALNKDQMAQIEREAKEFKDSLLYKVLDADCKYQSNKRMYIKSQSLIEMESGKNMLFIWDVIKSRIDNL